LLLAILRQQHHSSGDRLRWRSDVDQLTVDEDSPSILGVDTDDQARRLGAASANKSRHAHDLAGMHGERHVFDHALSRQSLHPKGFLADRDVDPRELLVDAAADHHPN
jgi:hypothetical protein